MAKTCTFSHFFAYTDIFDEKMKQFPGKVIIYMEIR